MGKNKYIETPEKMYELFLAYKNEVKSNPRKRHTFVGKDGISEFELLERPLTIEGFKSFCYDNIGCVHQYLVNQDGLYDNYMTVCTRIKDEIRCDQIEGGMVGQYNPSITQRLNGLKEHSESTVTNNHNILSLDPLNDTIDDSTKEDSGSKKEN